jgi:hypothetical protein
MSKSSATEHIQRINSAIKVYRRYSSTTKTIEVLMERYKVSRRQAYRYLQEALKTGQLQPVPGRKIVFTVRLAESLVQQLRKLAEKTGRSLSELTAEALAAFLKQGGRRG